MKALKDAGIAMSAVEKAVCGYVYGKFLLNHYHQLMMLNKSIFI